MFVYFRFLFKNMFEMINSVNISGKFIRLFSFSVLFSLFFSCGDKDPIHTIDSELEPYLDRFLQEGEKRGNSLNLKKEGIIMEFADLTPPTIGLCHYTLPRKIQIDRDYWKKTTQSANRENLREDVVFHELAHGFLGRRHLNYFLPNTEWVSMMCGGDEVDSRSWAVNFNGYRKEYYLDELFNLHPDVPAWSQSGIFDGNKGFLILSEDYSSSEESEYTEDIFTYKKGDGFYTISSTDTQNRLLSLEQINISGDFYFEINLSASFSSEGGIIGLFAGQKAGNYENHNYFSISSENRSYIANTNCIAPFAEVLTDDKFEKEEENKIALAKRGEEFFFYVNDKLVYRNDYQLNYYNQFGVIVPLSGSISIRNYGIYASNPDAVRSQSTLRSGQPETFAPSSFRLETPSMNYRK